VCAFSTIAVDVLSLAERASNDIIMSAVRGIVLRAAVVLIKKRKKHVRVSTTGQRPYGSSARFVSILLSVSVFVSFFLERAFRNRKPPGRRRYRRNCLAKYVLYGFRPV